MSLTYQELLARLQDRTNYESLSHFDAQRDYAVGPVERLLAKMEIAPDKMPPTVNITGSVGKGTTALYLEWLLLKEGLSVGTYLSPHLEEYTERIRLGGRDITPEEFSQWGGELEMASQGGETFFEWLTALALMAFFRTGQEVVICEVGLGGAGDATNVVPSQICLFTPIEEEHLDKMGGSLASIVQEKSGIIKDTTRVVIDGSQCAVAAPVLEEKAQAVGAELWRHGRDFHWAREEKGICFKWRELSFSVPGKRKERWQMENLLLAFMAFHALGLYFPDWRKNLNCPEVRLPGRQEVVGERPKVVIDGGHTEKAIRELAIFVKDSFSQEPRVLLLGMLDDKSTKAMGEELKALGDIIIFTTPPSPRALPAEELARKVGRESGRCIPDNEKAMEVALSLAGEEGVVVVAGSFVLAGAVRKYLKKRTPSWFS